MTRKLHLKEKNVSLSLLMKSLTHTYHLKPDFAPLQMVYKATNVGEKSGVGAYRYGFNGHEKVDELKGAGNHYTAQYWEMDPRLGRRWNVDPVVKSYESPYAILGNNPIWFVDPLGADTTFYRADGSYDSQARLDFDNAYNRVKTRVGELESEIQILNEKLANGNLSNRQTRLTERAITSAQNALNDWNSLYVDFVEILNSPDFLFRYSSNTNLLREDESGKIGGRIDRNEDGQVVGGIVTITIRPGRDDAVVHENRHGNQIMNDTYFTRPVLELEREAYINQRIYDNQKVQQIIRNARDLQFSHLPEHLRPLDYGLDDMIKFIYKDLIKD